MCVRVSMSVCLRVSSHVHVCDRVFACERVCERMWCLCMCVSVCELALPVVFPCRESAAWNVRLDRRRSHRLVPHPPAGCPHPPFSHASLEREVGPGLPCGWGLSQSAGWGRVMSVALLCPGLFSSQTEVPSGQGQGPSGPQHLRGSGALAAVGAGWSGQQSQLLAEPALICGHFLSQMGAGQQPLLFWARGLKPRTGWDRARAAATTAVRLASGAEGQGPAQGPAQRRPLGQGEGLSRPQVVWSVDWAPLGSLLRARADPDPF